MAVGFQFYLATHEESLKNLWVREIIERGK